MLLVGDAGGGCIADDRCCRLLVAAVGPVACNCHQGHSSQGTASRAGAAALIIE